VILKGRDHVEDKSYTNNTVDLVGIECGTCSGWG